MLPQHHSLFMQAPADHGKKKRVKQRARKKERKGKRQRERWQEALRELWGKKTLCALN